MDNDIITIDDLSWVTNNHGHVKKNGRVLDFCSNTNGQFQFYSTRLELLSGYIVKHNCISFGDLGEKHSWSVISPKKNIVFSHSIEKDGEENGFGNNTCWKFIHIARVYAPEFF